MQVVYVDTPESLSTAIDAILLETDFIAVDTEFRREDTYFPQLCLIQIATSTTVFLIDALALDSLSPLFPILENKNLLKVFHSGRQDLEIFCNIMGNNRVVTPVFDTQIAAMFLGHGETPGFEGLVHKLLKISIDKSSRHTDWTQRPLTDAQRTYAVADVLHLRPLYKSLIDELTELGRLEWVHEESRQLEVTERLIPLPKDSWKKLNISKPSPKELLALQLLSEWRERTAQKTNTPRSWVMKDEAIQQLAKRLPTNMNALKQSRHLQLSDDIMLSEILEIAHKVIDTSDTELPPPYKKLTVTTKLQHNLLDILKLLLQMTAQELNLSPKIIAEKDHLILFILSKGSMEGLPPATQGWRYQVFWKKAIDLYRGKSSLHIHESVIKLVNKQE